MDNSRTSQGPSGGVDIHTFQAEIRAARAATAAAGGAGFEFSPELVEAQLRECQELSRQYRDALVKAEQAGYALHEPAPDQPGSVLLTNRTRQSLTSLAAVIQSQIGFLENWRHTLAQAKANYLRNEHLTEDQWLRLANGPR